MNKPVLFRAKFFQTSAIFGPYVLGRMAATPGRIPTPTIGVTFAGQTFMVERSKPQ